MFVEQLIIVTLVDCVIITENHFVLWSSLETNSTKKPEKPRKNWS